MSTDSNEVPVSVVDMDVPVTAIDEVLEDYESNIVDYDARLLIRTESAHSKGRKEKKNAQIQQIIQKLLCDLFIC